MRLVSAPFLDVLGVHLLLEEILCEEDQSWRGASGRHRLCTLAAAFWRHAMPLARALVLNGKGYTVIGVLPANFRFFDDRPV